MKRILSIILALAMVMSFMPTVVFGAEETAVAKIDDTTYATFEAALKELTSGATLTLLSDITVDYDWDVRYTGGKITFPVTIDGDGHNLKFTEKVYDGGNYLSAFRFEDSATVKNLTIDMSEAKSGFNGRFRAISSKTGDLTVDNCTFIGNGSANNTRAIIFGEGADAAILAETNIVITNSAFKGWGRGVSDNENAKDVATVKIWNNKFDDANVFVSANTSVEFNNNKMENAWVNITSYSDEAALSVVAKENTLCENNTTSSSTTNQISNFVTTDIQGGFVLPWDGVTITNASELRAFRDAVNSGTDYTGKTVVMTADIDLADEDWTPIGNSTYPFTGTFDGQGHTISNVFVTTENSNAGLFGTVARQTDNVTGTVQNLTVHNATIVAGGQNCAGVIAVAPLGARVANVKLTGKVAIQGYRGVGGIVGNGFPTMNNCSVEAEGTITATYWGVGGILGFASDKGAKVSNSTVTATGEGLIIHGELGGVGAVTGTPHGAATNGAAISGVNITSNNNYYMAYVDASGTVSGAVTVENVKIKVKGEEIIGCDAVAKIGNVTYATLQEALNAAAAGTGNVTVEILSDIDLTDVDWNPVTVSAPGYPVVTLNGNNKTITGLNDMLFAGTWAGDSGLIINDLTIANSNIVNDKDDTKGTVGVGAFIGYPQASATITLNNCHLVDSTVEGGHWTGGLIGMAGGYNGNDGPVFMNLTITGCSVKDSAITGKGSVGGIIGHGSCAAWTNVVIENTNVSGNTITSTGSSNVKAGAVMGTIGAAGQSITVNGETKIGGASVSATVSDNNVTSNGTTITTIYGRQGTETGMLYVTGGAYEHNPIESDVAYAQPKEGFEIVQNTDGTYGVAEKTAAAAKIGETEYATLADAIADVGEGETVVILAGTISEGTIKLPANLKNVTFKGEEGAVLKDMTIMASDGNSFSYIGLTFDGIIFDNSRLLFTGWRNGDEIIENLTVTNCTFKNLDDETTQACVHINKDVTEPVNGFTFTNNVIDGATGGDKSGIYTVNTGNVTITGNTFNNIKFRPALVQLADCDGNVDNVVVSDNVFSDTTRLQIYGSEKKNSDGTWTPTGTDDLDIVITENIFKNISGYYICTWGINGESNIAKNYYDSAELGEKIYWNNEKPADEAGLAELGVYPVYKELNEDGTINEDSAYSPEIIQAGLDGEGTIESPYLINNIDDLKWFRDDVNAGNTYDDKYIKLTADIDLENANWTPIGTATNNFCGNFDGGNKTISNLKLDGDKTYVSGGNNDNYKGLFGYMKGGNNAAIKNLNLNNVSVTGCLYVGTVLGRSYTGGIIENCHVTGDVFVDGYSYIGGLVGRHDYSAGLNANGVKMAIYNCSVKDTDGTAGTINGDYAVTYVGGIVGFMGEGDYVIDSCAVENVNVSGVYGVGGVSGIGHYGNKISESSVNKVTVTSTNNNTSSDRTGNVGLIAGATQGTASQPTVYQGNVISESTGSVTYTDGTTEEVNAIYGTSMTGEVPVTNYIAEIDGVVYETLEAAIDAAKDGDTITLLKDAELVDTLIVDKAGAITIDGNGKKIKLADSFANTNSWGAAIMVGNSGYGDADTANHNVTIKNVVFDSITGNSIIRAQGITLAIEGCTVMNCNSANTDQGMLRIDSTVATISDSAFQNNKATKIIGHNHNTSGSASALVIDNCEFSKNTISGPGVVVLSSDAGCTIQKSEFVENNVTCSNGATVYLGFTENNIITGNLFQQNVVTGNATNGRVAGALFIGYTNEVYDNAFVSNTATNAAGTSANEICIDTIYALPAYGYPLDIDISDNYFNGEKPVEGDDYVVNNKVDTAYSLDSYYTSYTTENGNVVFDKENLVSLIKVAKIGETEYATLQEAIDAAQNGDEIVVLSELTISEETVIDESITISGETVDANSMLTIANGVTLISENLKGNYYAEADATVTVNTPNAYLVAGGNLTFVGENIVSGFSAGYSNRVITIQEGNSLKVTTSRLTVSYGNTFNIKGNIENAKETNKENITPSLELVGGISFSGNGNYGDGTDVSFNVENAYVILGDSTTKNKDATGTFNINFTNSIVDFTKTLKTYQPSVDGLNPTINLNWKDSVVSTASHLELWRTATNMTLDNTDLTVDGSFANAGAIDVVNGASFVVKAPIMSSHGGNTGTITIDGAVMELVDSNEDWQNNGTIKVTADGKLITNDFASTGLIIVDAMNLAAGTNATVIENANGTSTSLEGKVTLENGEDVTVTYGVTGSVTIEKKAITEHFTLAGTTASLNSSLALNFYLTPSEDATGSDYVAVVERDKQSGVITTEIPYSEWVSTSYGLGVLYTDIAACEIVDNIRLTVYDADRNKVSDTFETSLRDYVIGMMDYYINEGDTQNLWLYAFADMLNYGAGAQKLFNYKQDNLANAVSGKYTDYASETYNITNEGCFLPTELIAGTTVTFNDKTKLNVYFVPGADIAKVKYSYTTTGKTKIEREVLADSFVSDGTYSVLCVDEIAIADTNKLVTITMYDKNDAELDTAIYSVDAYLLGNINAGNKAEIFPALAKFSASARKAFTKK